MTSLFVCPDPEREQREMYAELAEMGFNEASTVTNNVPSPTHPSPRADQRSNAQ